MKNKPSFTGTGFLTLLFSVSILINGCAAGPKLSGDKTYSEKAILLDVAFKRQSDPTLCGLATVEMLTLYYNQSLTKAQLKELKEGAAKKKGISGLTLTAALQTAGYYTAIFAGTLDKKTNGLYHHLDLHRPLVVMLSPEGGQANHYQLVTGYDPKLSLVSILDPARGPLAMPLASFKASWERAHFFTLLAVPKNQDKEIQAK
jgi:ABC-type bacteriocin/lantibiotic exporter with double-glycine peptidase domain